MLLLTCYFFIATSIDFLSRCISFCHFDRLQPVVVSQLFTTSIVFEEFKIHLR